MCGLAPAAGAAGWLEPAPLPQHAHTAKPGSSSSARGTMRLSTAGEPRGYKLRSLSAWTDSWTDSIIDTRVIVNTLLELCSVPALVILYAIWDLL